MDATGNIATDLFFKIRSRFSGLKLGTDTGEITIVPEDARFFDFDYIENQVPIGHISISLAEPNSMKVYFSHAITENMDGQQKHNWYRFLREMRRFAKRRLMNFDTRDIVKDNLDRRDYEFLTKVAKPKSDQQKIQKPVGESNKKLKGNAMNESTMYGTKTVSYQKLMDTRLIIKHNRTLEDDTQPGARSRNISALFVENQDGERFKYPFVHLAGARAMQRHVANGGLPYDEIGESIINMSQEIAHLKNFGSYVVRNDLMNSSTNGIIERSSDRLAQLREQISRLAKQGYYQEYRENFQGVANPEIPDDIVEDLTEKFTVKNFREDIKDVFPILYRLMQENQDELGYNDIVAMTEISQTNEQPEQASSGDPFAQFEHWVDRLGESSALVSDDKTERAAAVENLKSIVEEPLPVGVDGMNAIESVKGIIEDSELFGEFKKAAREDAESDARPMIKFWIQSNAPDMLEEIEFSEEEKDEESQKESTSKLDKESLASIKKDLRSDASLSADRDDYYESSQDPVDTGQLAEFISSFYDRETGTFPKGPEGVCTMVGKKFGEQAEQIARKFVERMAPQQATDNNPELQELARLRELSGVR